MLIFFYCDHCIVIIWENVLALRRYVLIRNKMYKVYNLLSDGSTIKYSCVFVHK